MFDLCGHTCTCISAQALQDKFDQVAAYNFMWYFVHFTKLKKENTTWFVFVYIFWARGSLMYFENGNNADMKYIDEYLKCQTLIFISETIRL